MSKRVVISIIVILYELIFAFYLILAIFEKLERILVILGNNQRNRTKEKNPNKLNKIKPYITMISNNEPKYKANIGRNKGLSLARDKEKIALTIRKMLENGSYRMLQGVFNVPHHQTIEDQAVRSGFISEDLDQTHHHDSITLYN